MAVPEHTDRQAAEKISVGFAIGIPYSRSLTADEGDLIASIGLDNDLVSLGNNLLVGHVCTPICGAHVVLRRLSRQAITRGKMRVVQYHTAV